MSSLDLFARYARQRMRLELFAPLAAALAVVGSVLPRGNVITYGDVGTSALEILFLIIAFRVWDDLADREHDRAGYPERVMTSTGSTAQFATFAFLFFGAGLGLMLFQADVLSRILAVAIAAGLSGTWYLLKTPSTARGPGAYLVLAKYPAFTYAAMPGSFDAASKTWPRVLLILTAVYVAICIYETLEDPGLRKSFGGASLQ